MFTPSSASSYPSYTPLPTVPSKTGTSCGEPRLRKIHLVETGSVPRRESSGGHDYTRATNRSSRSPVDGSSMPRATPLDVNHLTQRYNAPIFSPPTGAAPAAASLSSAVTSPWCGVSFAPPPLSAPNAPPRANTRAPLRASDAAHSAVVHGEGHSKTGAPLSQPGQRSHSGYSLSRDTQWSDQTARLHLVAAECEDLLSVLHDGSSSPTRRSAERQTSLRAAQVPRMSPSSLSFDMAEPTRLANSAVLSSQFTEDEEARGYLHEPQLVLSRGADNTFGGLSSAAAQQPCDGVGLGVRDNSNPTYTALMSALQELADEQHQQQLRYDPDHQSIWETEGGEHTDGDSALCVAPPDLVPELDSPADLIGPFCLRWLLFLVQRRERRLQKQETDSTAGLSEDGRLVLKMAVTLRESLSYIQNTLGTTLTRQAAQHLSQLLVHVSNVVSRFAHEDDAWQQTCGQNRDVQASLLEELKRSADTLDATLDERDSLARELESAQAALQTVQQQLHTAQAEREALTSHYDRVAADNAEILARLQAAEAEAQRAAQRSRDRDDAAEASQRTTSTEQRCAIESLQEEYDRLQALMNRQTNSMRDLRGDLDAAESENDHLRAVIAQLRKSVLRHRTVVDLLTRQKKEGGVGLAEPSSQLIEDILSGARTIDGSDSASDDSHEYF